MAHREGSRRWAAAQRKAARGGGRAPHRRRATCQCGLSFQYPPGTAAPEMCPACASIYADRATVYDRDRSIG
jgi:hypothetical protein